MSYTPPQGWVEVISPLERRNVFHEDAGCATISSAATMQHVERPGRCQQCPACVHSTATAVLAG